MANITIVKDKNNRYYVNIHCMEEMTALEAENFAKDIQKATNKLRQYNRPRTKLGEF